MAVAHEHLDRGEVLRRLSLCAEGVFGLGVKRLALFGSFQRDQASDTSDVDILVEFEPGQKTFDHFMALSELLEGAVGRRVDLVTTESLSPHIGPHILAEATDVLRAA